MPDDRKHIGALTERHVRTYLEGKGYVFRHANWRYGHGELDLVMADGDEIVFVEVKARRSERAGRAEEGVSTKQKGVLLRTADIYMQNVRDVEGKYWRIDLVAITLGWDGDAQDIIHYQNAIVIG